MIAKTGSPHYIAEKLILPAFKEFINTILHYPSSSVLKTIPLSNDKIRRRIDEMGRDIKDNLSEILRNQKFGIQLNESTLPGNESLLLGYVRFIK